MILKTETVAPIPSPRVRTTDVANPRFFESRRSVWRNLPNCISSITPAAPEKSQDALPSSRPSPQTPAATEQRAASRDGGLAQPPGLGQIRYGATEQAFRPKPVRAPNGREFLTAAPTSSLPTCTRERAVDRLPHIRPRRDRTRHRYRSRLGSATARQDERRSSSRCRDISL